MSAIQEIHDIEVNGGLAWPEEGKILVYLGCPLDPPPRTRMLGEALVGSFAEAEAWLCEWARERYGSKMPYLPLGQVQGALRSLPTLSPAKLQARAWTLH